MKFHEITYIPEFQRDLKKLKKRFRTLEEDVETLVKAGIAPFHKLGVETGGIVTISGLGIQYPKVYKSLSASLRR